MVEEVSQLETMLYPVLRKVKLTDYKVRILNSSRAFGTAAKTRVLIESTDGKDRWYTVGVNENIIEANIINFRDFFFSNRK